MTLLPNHRNVRHAAARGTTLTELMVAMAILLIIFMVMASLVSGIQKVFRAGRAQADVIENGRSAMDMIVRDLEQMDNAKDTFSNFQVTYPQAPRMFGANELFQTGEYFFRARDTNWHAYAYRIYSHSRSATRADLAGNAAVGCLYRWPSMESTTAAPLWTTYSGLAPTDFVPVMDGIVHFRLRPVSLGVLMGEFQTPGPAGTAKWGGVASPLNEPLPTHIEVELGLVDQRTADYLTSGPDQAAWLLNNLNKVYFFRQLVPIKNAYK